MTCSEFRGWGGTVSFKTNFASIWIKWSSMNSPLNWLLAEWLLLMISIPYHHFLHKHRYRDDSRFEKRENIWPITWLFNGFIKKLKQSYNLCIRLQCIQWSNRECRPSVWLAAAESFNEICKLKHGCAQRRRLTPLTSAQQHAPIHFILPHLKLNLTGG